MNILLLGAAGFIGTNLALSFLEKEDVQLTLVDRHTEYFLPILRENVNRVKIVESSMDENTDFDTLLYGQDLVFHLMSTTMPSITNQKIPEELTANVVVTAKMLDACVRRRVKKVVFLSSGGTVYGQVSQCPIKEDAPTNPISSYGVQKITIEKLLYLYGYLHGLDYRIVRLANPYGPYQRPNGMLGAITTFTYKALRNEEISVFGDGSVVRDFIYIDDAIRAILNIALGESEYKTFNVGSGTGTSISQVLHTIQRVLDVPLRLQYLPGRKADVPVNYLDIDRYEQNYGELNPISLEEGIKRTVEFMKEAYSLS